MAEKPAAIAREVRLIARAARSGALATSRRARRSTGQPYVSKVGIAMAADGTPLFLFSTLAAHTQDVLADPRASLLVEAPAHPDNPLEAPRATLVGRVTRLDAEDALAARPVYLAHHPGAARYVGFGDFAFWRLEVEKVHMVGGFGRAQWVKGADYVAPCTDWSAARAALLDNLNGPRRGDLGAVVAARLGRAPRGWRALDVDADGLALAGPRGRRARLDFASPARDVKTWRSRFATWVKNA